MKLTAFKAEHLLEMDTLDTKDTVGQIDAIYQRGLKREGAKAFTAMHEGKIIGCGGIEILWEGVGEGWVVPSIHVADHKRETIEICIKGLKHILDEDAELKRIHALIMTGFPPGDRLMEILGFTYEGTLKKYGLHGEDYKMYALVR